MDKLVVAKKRFNSRLIVGTGKYRNMTECAKAIKCFSATNNNLSKYNKLAHHDSQQWYKAIIKDYVNKYGDLPSKKGPGKDIKLIIEE